MHNWAGRALAATILTSACWAVDWKELKPQGYVSDFAGVIDSGSRGQLNAYCEAVEHSNGAFIALVTLPTLHGEPVDDVAGALFRAWKTSQNNLDNGVLLLLAVGERRSALVAGSALQRILPDGLHDSVLAGMRRGVRQSDYGDAMMAAADRIGSAIAQAKHTAAPAGLRRRQRPSLWDFPWLLLAGAILLVPGLLLWLKHSAARRAPPLIPERLMTRPAWGRCGGGFGDPDSSDGFGGFGGGDTGSGRVSSDW